ncbi:flavin reductase family protein [Dactylosporangium vinaceum]|uniref:Flavin reductase family protein n=1 Tax=Dactylosporangium vinaceum TaxID=53362 RepID=A0ABV5M9N8_9ACTN|nr:flavin reductase family protein [Dactylosporangium vinaceum]UAC00041.1 flavin reductase family protein [Dactylosporangium vinaceum]
MSPIRTNQDLDPIRLREVFGIYPSGVVAVAAVVDGVAVGLAASSFTSVSLEPPLVSFSIANASKTWPDLRRAPHLGVTILAEHHATVARQLAGTPARRFDALPITATPGGAVTLEDGLAQFVTTVHDEVAAGDHTIVLLRLISVRRSALADPSPLVFHRSRFGRVQTG